MPALQPLNDCTMQRGGAVIYVKSAKTNDFSAVLIHALQRLKNKQFLQ